MFALCPKCSTAVEDTGQGDIIICPECGTGIRSRFDSDIQLEREETKEPEEPMARPGVSPLEMTPRPPPPYFYTHPPPVWKEGDPPPVRPAPVPIPPPVPAPPVYPYVPPSHGHSTAHGTYPAHSHGGPDGWRASKREVLKPLKKGYDIIGNGISLLSLLMVILVCLTLLSNFVFILISIPLVYEGTMNDIVNENEGEFTIVVDDQAPVLNLIAETHPGTPLVDVSGMLSERNLAGVSMECGGRIWDLTPPMGSPENVHISQLFAPPLGAGTANITAVDRAGNFQRTSLTLPPAVDLADYIIPDEKDPFVKDSIRLNFVSSSNYTDARAEFVRGEDNWSVSLEPGINDVAIPALLKGSFTLTTSLTLSTEEVVTSAFSFSTLKAGERSPPNTTGLSIEDSVEMEEYWDELRVPTEQFSITITTNSRLKSAQLLVNNKEYGDQVFTAAGDDQYKIDILAPWSPGTYSFRVRVVDVFGEEFLSRNRTRSFTDAPFPRAYVYHRSRDVKTFPLYVRQGEDIIVGLENLRPIQEHNVSINGTAGGLAVLVPKCEDELQKVYSFDTTAARDGEYTLSLNARSSYRAKNVFFLVLPIPPFLFPFKYQLSGLGFFLYHMFLVAMIIGSLVVLFVKDGKHTLKAWLSPKTVRVGHKVALPEFPSLGSRNGFILVVQVFAATIFASMAIILLTGLFAGDFGSISSGLSRIEGWRWLYSLANASVAEELVSRFLLVGVPLFIYELVSRLVFKKKGNKLLNCLVGGGLKIEAKDIYLIVLSASLFGLAHMSGWSVWKVIPTFLFGIAAGYLFYKKGLYAAILIHFATDYLMAGQYVNNPLGVLISYFSALVVFVMLPWGFLYSIQYTREMFAKLFSIKKRPSELVILGALAFSLVLDVFIIFCLIYTGNAVWGIFLMFGLFFLGAGCFFALIKLKWPAFLLLLAGALFSIPVAFVSVLACVAAYDIYLKIREDGPRWVLNAYKKPTDP